MGGVFHVFVIGGAGETSTVGLSTDSSDILGVVTMPLASSLPLFSTAGRWTKPEHDAFVEGLRLYGKEWKRVAKLIPTRTVVQIRTHAQKYFQKLAKDMGVDEAYIHANVLTPPKAGVALASPGSAAVPAAVGSGGGA